MPSLLHVYLKISLTLVQPHCRHWCRNQLCRAIQAALLPNGPEHLLSQSRRTDPNRPARHHRSGHPRGRHLCYCHCPGPWASHHSRSLAQDYDHAQALGVGEGLGWPCPGPCCLILHHTRHEEPLRQTSTQLYRPLRARSRQHPTIRRGWLRPEP